MRALDPLLFRYIYICIPDFTCLLLVNAGCVILRTPFRTKHQGKCIVKEELSFIEAAHDACRRVILLRI